MKETASTRLEDLVKKRVRQEIIRKSAYKVASAEGYIKLDAMESAYTWPETVRAEWLSILQGVELNRYPDAAGLELCDEIKAWSELSDSTDIILGNGSDELIQMIIMTLGGPVLAPEPTFGMYKSITEAVGCKFIGVPLIDNFFLDCKQILSMIEEYDPSCIFLAYPNNPTGNLFDYAAIQTIIDSAEGLVILDEAYYPYCGKTFLQEISKNENLVVLRTFSKLGLAALRLGFLAGPHPWLKEINKVRLPYNINALTQVSVRFALSKNAWFQSQAEKTCTERNRFQKRLQRFSEVKVYKSETNFVLFRLVTRDSDVVFESLRDQKILIKNMNGSDEALRNCLRVTIGAPEENQKFFQALSIALKD